MIGCVPPDATAIGILPKFALRDFHDGVNRLDLRHQRQIGIFLFVRHGDVVERTALFLGEHFQDVARRHAAERIKTVFGKMQIVPAA